MVFKFNIIILLFIILSNCNDRSDFKSTETMKTVNYVDLEKYMGDWYVIANIPTFIEKNATNAIESAFLADGIIHTTFSFYKGSPEGEKKKYIAQKVLFIIKKLTLSGECNFLWPFKMPFLIIELDEDYSYTVIGYPSKKYVWIMARDPQMEEKRYNLILDNLSKIGYDISLIKKFLKCGLNKFFRLMKK